MRKVWKWIIGIVVGLVVLGLLVGAGFWIRNGIVINRGVARVYRGFEGGGRGIMPYGGFGYRMPGPGMMGFGYSPFGGFFGALFMLGFLVLLVLGIVWLVRRLSMPRSMNASTGTSTLSSTSAPAGTSDPMQAAAGTPCKKCGRPLQADWSVCPYCGKKV